MSTPLDGDAREGVLVSVLVPVLNEARHIREAAAAMLSQRVDGEFEILFVDGGSDDGTRAVLDELRSADARVRVLENPARRIPVALNIGLRAARGQFIARMDAHARYPDYYLQRGIERLRRGDVDWVSGPQIPQGHGSWSRRVALALGTPLGQGGSRKWRDASFGPDGDEVELDTGVFTGIWHRAAFDRYGAWDEAWTVNEDAEMAGRVLTAGGRIVCLAELGAHYAPRDTLAALWRQYWRFGYYRVKTAHRHPIALRRSHLLSAALAAIAGAGMLGRLRVARAARGALIAYGVGIVGASASTMRRASWSDAAALPFVLALMHLAWGCGFLCGCLRMGPPLKAMAMAAVPPSGRYGRSR